MPAPVPTSSANRRRHKKVARPKSDRLLEQVINGIKPRVEGILIHPVPISSAANHVAYVVEIPQSATAHQATDLRYYKRFNFQSVPMEDYEIRDILGRNQHPTIELLLGVESGELHYGDLMGRRTRSVPDFKLKVVMRNKGNVYAEYVNVILTIPSVLLPTDSHEGESVEQDGQKCQVIRLCNTVRDVVDTRFDFNVRSHKYGPSRFDPILPKLSHIHRIRLVESFDTISADNLRIHWSVYADNATPRSGAFSVRDIPVKPSDEAQ
jgi:hypothetical protein